MTNSLVYYLLYSSFIFVHGLCLEWVIFRSENIRELPLRFGKNLICVSSTSLLTSLVMRGVHGNTGFGDLMPFIAVLAFTVTALLCEALIRITAKRSAAELAMPLLCVIFAHSETRTLTMALFLSIFALLTFYLAVLLMYSFRKRLDTTKPSPYFAGPGLLFLSLAVLALIMFSLGTAWINPEVAR
jgi:Mg2+/Co2+ transporter CorB